VIDLAEHLVWIDAKKQEAEVQDRNMQEGRRDQAARDQAMREQAARDRAMRDPARKESAGARTAGRTNIPHDPKDAGVSGRATGEAPGPGSDFVKRSGTFRTMKSWQPWALAIAAVVLIVIGVMVL
jgi:hypothetical protein